MSEVVRVKFRSCKDIAPFGRRSDSISIAFQEDLEFRSRSQ